MTKLNERLASKYKKAPTLKLYEEDEKQRLRDMWTSYLSLGAGEKRSSVKLFVPLVFVTFFEEWSKANGLSFTATDQPTREIPLYTMTVSGWSDTND